MADLHDEPLHVLVGEWLRQQDDGRQYTAEDITVLGPTEAIRRRPGMYVGSVDDPETAVHLLEHAVLNLLHTASRDRPRWEAPLPGPIRVIVETPRCVRVEHAAWNELFIPGPEAAQALFTDRLLRMGGTHAGAAPDAINYQRVGAPASLVLENALSRRLELELVRGDEAWRVICEEGWAREGLRRIPEATRWTSCLRFELDPLIFSPACVLELEQVEPCLERLALLFPLTTIELSHEPTGTLRTFASPHGLAGRLRAQFPLVDHELFAFQHRGPAHLLDVALGWHTRWRTTHIEGYANARATLDGGAHHQLLRDALHAACDRLYPDDPSWTHALDGLVAIIAVDLPDPHYEGARYDRLINRDLRDRMFTPLVDALADWLRARPRLPPD